MQPRTFSVWDVRRLQKEAPATRFSVGGRGRHLGLVISLAVAAVKFIAILYEFIIKAWTETEADLIVDVLALIDLSLVGNLILIVVLSGYVNFVSRIDPDGHPDW